MIQIDVGIHMQTQIETDVQLFIPVFIYSIFRNDRLSMCILIYIYIYVYLYDIDVYTFRMIRYNPGIHKYIVEYIYI